MGQCGETEKGVRPSETLLCWQHDNQTKAQRISLKRKVSSGSSRVSRKRRKTESYDCSIAFKKKLDSGESSSSDSEKDITTSDSDSDNSSSSEITLGSQSSLESSCMSNHSKGSTECFVDFKKKDKEETSPPNTQELVAGSCAEMERKSTYHPVSVQTRPPTTIQPVHQLLLSVQ